MKSKTIIDEASPTKVPYNFYYWGPFLWKTKVAPELIKFLLKESKPLKESFNKKLAGDLSQQMLYSKQSHKRVWDKLRIYIDGYFKAFQKEWNCTPGVQWNPLNVWIN